VISATQTLSAGPQAINVKYFEYTSGQSLTVQYKGPDTGNSWITIPSSALRTGNAPPSPMIAAKSTTANTREVDEKEEIQLSDIITVNVFPNPSSADNIHLQVETAANIPVRVRMIDMVGRPHYQKVFTPEQLQAGAKITPNGTLLNGIYIILIDQGNTRIKQKISIQN
jgi:hypothetical protein